MVSLPVFDKQGTQVGTYEIDPAEFAPRINKQLLHDAVVMYQANKRLGTVKTKGRSEVAGSTRKLYRQKGTGRARAGNRRTNIRRGGGMAHALRPRDWSYRLPRKALQLATRMAIAARLRDQEIVLLNELSFSEPRTRDMAAVLKALKLYGVRLLLSVPSYDVNVYKSARNIEGLSVLPVGELNALEVLRPRRLLMTTAAMDALRARLRAEGKTQPAETEAEQPAAVG